MEVLLITLPIFLLIGLGYILRSFRGVTRDGIHALNNFVYWVALPAIILISFWDIDWFDQTIRDTLLFNCGSVALFAAILFFLVRFLPVSAKAKAGIFIAGLVGNTVYMGFPIGKRALGEHSFDIFLASATPHLVLGIALSILAIEWLVLRSHNPLRYVKDFLLNPLIVALGVGILLSVFEMRGGLFELLREPITMLAATASPIALVTLGAFLRGAFSMSMFGLSLVASGAKLLLFPLVILILGTVVGSADATISASVLAAAMPTAVTSFVIAEKYDAHPKLVASTLFLSTVCSIGTLSLLLSLM